MTAFEAGTEAADNSSAVDVLVEYVARRRPPTPADKAAVEQFYEAHRDPDMLTVDEWRRRHGP